MYFVVVDSTYNSDYIMRHFVGEMEVAFTVGGNSTGATSRIFLAHLSTPPPFPPPAAVTVINRRKSVN
jgi:hypothetical protein